MQAKISRVGIGLSRVGMRKSIKNSLFQKRVEKHNITVFKQLASNVWICGDKN